jgi:hypothetical protein
VPDERVLHQAFQRLGPWGGDVWVLQLGFWGWGDGRWAGGFPYVWDGKGLYGDGEGDEWGEWDGCFGRCNGVGG